MAPKAVETAQSDLEPDGIESSVVGVMFPTEYTLDAFGADDPDWGTWQIRLVWRGADSWAVQQGGFSIVLSRGGEWAHEPGPSNRTDEFLQNHRFTLDEAVRVAHRELGRLSVNGMTAAQVKERRSEGGGSE